MWLQPHPHVTCDNRRVAALYRTYRPLTFSDVIGQEAVVRTLRNAIEHDQVRQAYLIAGPRGTGKTSLARILAKALNAPAGPSADFDPAAPVARSVVETGFPGGIHVAGSGRAEPRHLRGSP